MTFAGLAGRGGEAVPLSSLCTEPSPPGRALALGLLTLAGLPPTSGLWARLAVLVPAWQQAGR